MKLSTPVHDAFCEKLAGSGLRPTPQREMIYHVILSKRDHPTAEEIFSRVKSRLPGTSLATVYNCLETLAQCGLVRQVNFEREPTRYCPNLHPHAHFHDDATGEVHDVALPPEFVAGLLRVLPAGFAAASVDLSFRGSAPAAGN